MKRFATQDEELRSLKKTFLKQVLSYTKPYAKTLLHSLVTVALDIRVHIDRKGRI
jgi:hypothetical protein